MDTENAAKVAMKPKRPKKFKVIKIAGVPGVVVSCWEEEEEARQQGFQSFHYSEKVKKRKRTPKKKWLSGRVRYGRPDGIFDVK